MACNGITFLSRSPIPSLTSSPTEIPSPTVTPAPTATPLPTRTASPTLIPGIEVAVDVDDAKLFISKALRRDTFRCGAASEAADYPERNTFLVLPVAVEGGPRSASAQLEKWLRVNAIDPWAVHFSGAGIAGASLGFFRSCIARDKDTLALTELGNAFDVEITADGFLPALPDETEIPLDSLVP
ncbi:MAG: hypothetical protein WBM17_03885 [Anaerolineales bacterium]